MEMNEERKTKGNTVLLTVIAIATLLVAVIGATFAYFSVAVSGNSSTSTSVIVQTATLGIQYETGSAIIANNIIPGDTIPSKTFTIKNSGQVAMTYNVIWKDVTNSIINDELTYGVVGNNTTQSTALTGVAAGTPVPATATTASMMSGISIDPNDIHEYVLTLSFPDTGSEQNYNQTKSFAAKIEVTTEAVSNP